MIALFASVSISASMDEAEALKTKNTYVQKYGKIQNPKYAGDKLCSFGEGKDPVNVGRYN